MNMINLTIDGIPVKVKSGTTVMEAAKSIGIDIPALCYLKGVNEVGACRICVVEVERARTLQASCVLPVAEGMVVHTESPAVVEARKEILKLILDNHPNDCLTCDKAGECKLQEYAYRYDVKFREHDGARRNAIIDTSNPYILRDNNKCILCGRCVSTCSQIQERSVLSFGERGFETHIIADNDRILGESSCVSCGRCISVCPVGALIDNRIAGKARAWETEKEEVKCTQCEYGCNFELLKKDGVVLGVRAKEPGEGRPLCLKGKLSVDLTYNPKPLAPLMKKDDQYVEVSWAEALGLEKIIDKL
ncbi:MAG: 4Fe-4S dicluster domain-containing protein [Clostridiales bacterium]|nr:4Fe-4S dicluster domain-containing protein [Clostridiales bacterium]